ncbi:MAG TPA: TetR/AcrR family transcriptional regulator [Nitrolancea sp.]|nr:TetR/AcrR family transcriptional regulator [Nitrolancea sp.]
MTTSQFASPINPKQPGRPRSARARQAILDATLQLLVEEGFDRMSIEAVAARAGVGKATIYRRWSSKCELVAAALASIDDEIQAPDTGNTRDDLVSLVRDFARVSLSTAIGPMIGRVAGAAASNPELLEIVWTNLIAKRQEIGRQLLRRGIERGDVRADTNLDVVMNMVAGTAIFAVLFRLPEPDDLSTRLESLVKTLWQGIQAHPPDATPIHPADVGGSVATNSRFRDC